jgi:hypothetical protein
MSIILLADIEMAACFFAATQTPSFALDDAPGCIVQIESGTFPNTLGLSARY